MATIKGAGLAWGHLNDRSAYGSGQSQERCPPGLIGKVGQHPAWKLFHRSLNLCRCLGGTITFLLEAFV